MSHGKYQHAVLANAYSRSHLMEQTRKNNIPWEESGHEGVDWMRASGAVVNHLNQGRDFHMEDTEPEKMRQVLSHYTKMRELHKETMIPHVKAALQKLHQDGGDPHKNPMDYLEQVYAHLDQNGGHYWAEKVHVLTSLNRHIANMTSKLKDLGHIK